MANYGTIAGAVTYFSERLGTTPWDNAVVGDRTKALIMATKAIDRLNFAGDMADEDQGYQFPRGEDTSVPQDILDATYECAIAFLDDVDLEMEQEAIGVVTESYSGARTTYDSHNVQDHIRAGIPSITAWNILIPYLRDPQEVSLSRVT